MERDQRTSNARYVATLAGLKLARKTVFIGRQKCATASSNRPAVAAA